MKKEDKTETAINMFFMLVLIVIGISGIFFTVVSSLKPWPIYFAPLTSLKRGFFLPLFQKSGVKAPVSRSHYASNKITLLLSPAIYGLRNGNFIDALRSSSNDGLGNRQSDSNAWKNKVPSLPRRG